MRLLFLPDIRLCVDARGNYVQLNHQDCRKDKGVGWIIRGCFSLAGWLKISLISIVVDGCEPCIGDVDCNGIRSAFVHPIYRNSGRNSLVEELKSFSNDKISVKCFLCAFYLAQLDD